MSEYVLTPNLGLFKPNWDGDEDEWGNHTNANWDTLDTVLAHGAGITVSGSPPALTNGALWFDSVSTQLYVGYDDGNSLQWVIANNYGGGGGLYLPLTGGTVTGATTFSGAGTGLAVSNNATVGGEVIPSRLNLGSANGNGLAMNLSPTQGLDHTGSPFWLNYYFTGANTRTGNQNFNSIIVNDLVDYSGNGQSNALFIRQYSGAQADRAGGLWVECSQTAAPTKPFGFSTALTAASSLGYNCGGTALTPAGVRGAATTLNTYTSAGPGATFLNGIVGYEMDIHAQAGSSLGGKTGLLIVRLADDAVSGAFGTDTGIMFSGPSPTAGWNYMLAFGGFSGQIPYKSTATFLYAGEPQTPSTGQALASWGIDFSGVVFSGGFARSLGFVVDGSGNTNGQRFNMSNWSLVPSSSGLTVNPVGQRASLTSIASGGGGWSVGDKCTTSNGGVYQVTAVSGGAATGVTQLVADVAVSPPANPVTTTATNVSVFRSNGVGLTLNLAWTAANTLALQSTGGAATFGGTLGVSGNLTASGVTTTLGSGAGNAGVQFGNTGNAIIQLGATTSAFQIKQGTGTAVNISGTSGSPANYFQVLPAVAGSLTVWATAQGSDTNVTLGLNGQGTGGVNIGGRVGFNNTAPIAKPTVTGAKGSNAALGSLITALASYGLVTDSTSA